MNRVTRSLALLTATVVSAAAARVEAAEPTWSIVETAPGDPTEKDKNPAPVVKVKVVGEVAPKGDEVAKWKLKQTDVPKARPVSPSQVVPYHKSSETLTLVVLVEGHEFYFGNDKYVEEVAKPAGEDEAVEFGTPRSAGVYDVILAALDAPGAKDDEIPKTISRAGPPGSKGALIVYSVGVDVRYPLGDLRQLQGDKLGPQDMQKDKRRRDFVDGLREAHAQLKRSNTSRKVLFIISDGFDGSGSEEIKAIKNQLNNDKVEVYAFHLEADTKYIAVDATTKTKNGQNMDALAAPNAKSPAKTAEELAKKIASVIENDINNRFWLTFPGQVIDAKTKMKSGFTWDGKLHEVQLIKDDDEEMFKGQEIVLAPVWGQKKGGGLWWLGLAIPGAILVLGVAILLLSGKKQPAPVPMPMPVAQPAAPPPIQAAPAQANKTMAINISSGDGVPVVGWLVPINGPQSFQTFKLVAGSTRIGNAQGAHIVINDGYMSGQHAEIAMSPNGFTLIDNNSTNGTFVNERRVQRHELIDNDVIKFGKTDCKFKTILG